MFACEPSYDFGFAPRDYEPEYPELWDGRVLSCCPSLGPTGDKVFDWSGRQQSGTLNGFTLGTDWGLSSGKNALAFTSSKYVDFGNILNFDYTDPQSGCVWLKWASGADGFNLVTKQQNSGSFFGYGLGTGNGSMELFLYASATSLIVKYPSYYADSLWHCIGWAYNGSKSSTGLKLYADGAPVTGTVVTNTLNGSWANTASFQWNGRGGATACFTGSMDGLAIFNNFQPPSTFSLLNSIGRGGDYAYRQPTIAKRIVVPSAASAKNLMPYYLKGANA